MIEILSGIHPATYGSGGLLLNQVKPIAENMESNLIRLNNLVASEQIMMKLSGSISHQKAHDLVHKASISAIEQSMPLKKALLQNQLIMEHFTEEEIDSFLNPRKYLGNAMQCVERVAQ